MGTLCFWSASKFIDLLGDQLVNLIPLLPGIGLNTTCLGDSPAHFVMYSLNDDGIHSDSCSSRPGKHLEDRKDYLVDLMIWNSDVRQLAEIKHRYSFQDA